MNAHNIARLLKDAGVEVRDVNFFGSDGVIGITDKIKVIVPFTGNHARVKFGPDLFDTYAARSKLADIVADINKAREAYDKHE